MRCHVLCRTGTPDEKARVFRVSATPDGYCVNCAATEFLKTTPPICELLAADRSKVEGLRLPHVQEQFGAMVAAGNGQVDPKHIDWLEVIANWELPFPKIGKARRA
jgi:hypothetical protein